MCVCAFYRETARASGTVSPTGIASRRERAREKVKRDKKIGRVIKGMKGGGRQSGGSRGNPREDSM